MMNHWLREQDAAGALGISVTELHRRVSTGEIPTCGELFYTGKRGPHRLADRIHKDDVASLPPLPVRAHERQYVTLDAICHATKGVPPEIFIEWAKKKLVGAYRAEDGTVRIDAMSVKHQLVDHVRRNMGMQVVGW